jgi:hypothetical protein
MANFFQDIEYERALDIERLSKLAYELRENRSSVLATYGASDEAALLEQICNGALAEHPAYEHYLAACILDETRESARQVLSERLKEVKSS